MPRRTGVAADTRQLIWDAARGLFAAGGYAGTSVRDIAAEAGVDPALVVRHFGGKEQLFLDTMRLDDDDPLELLHGDLATMGERMVRRILDADDQLRSIYVALVRAGDSGGITSRLHGIHDQGFVEPLLARLEGPDRELRARLVASTVGGLMYSLWLVRDERLTADPEALVRRLGAEIQRLVTP